MSGHCRSERLCCRACEEHSLWRDRNLVLNICKTVTFCLYVVSLQHEDGHACRWEVFKCVWTILSSSGSTRSPNCTCWSVISPMVSAGNSTAQRKKEDKSVTTLHVRGSCCRLPAVATDVINPAMYEEHGAGCHGTACSAHAFRHEILEAAD